MLPERRMFEDEACPVPDDVLGEMYRANSHGLNELIVSVPPAVRGMLAMYCYRRAHLASIALGDRGDLRRGRSHAPRRQRRRRAVCEIARGESEAPRVAAHPVGRRRITLASGTLRNMVPENDEEEDAAVAAP